MADIIKDIKPDQGSSFLGYSKGYQAAEGSTTVKGAGFAGLVQGLADLIPPLATAGDKIVKEAIDEDIYKRNDELNTEFGATAAVALMSESQPIPTEIRDAEKYLGKLDKAASQGKISRNSLGTKVDALARTLRSRYGSQPYLRDYIDGKVSQVTGIQPQNEVRRNLIAEFEKLNNAQSESSDYMFKQKIQKANDIHRDFGVTYSDLDQIDLAELNSRSAPLYKAKYDRDVMRDDITRAKNLGELNDEQLQRKTQEVVLNSARTAFHEFTRQFGDSDPKAIIAEFDAIKNDKTPAGVEKRAMLANQVDQLVATVRNQAIQEVNRTHGAANLTKEKIENIISPIMAEAESLATIIKTYNAGALEIFTQNTKTMIASDQSKMVANPILREMAAGNGIFGSDITAMRFNQRADSLAKNDPRGHQAFMTGFYESINGTPLSTTLKKAQINGLKSESAAKDIILDTVTAFNSPNATEDQVNKTATALYSPENATLIAGLKNVKAKSEVYSQMISNKSLDTAIALKKAGQPEAFNNLVNFAKTNFTTIYNESLMAAQSENSEYTVSFNPESNRIVVVPKPSKGSAMTDNSPEALRGLARSVNSASYQLETRLNSAIDSLVPVLEANKDNPTAFLQPFLNRLGIKSEVMKPSKLGGPSGVTMTDQQQLDTLMAAIDRGSVFPEIDPGNGQTVFRIRPGADASALYQIPGQVQIDAATGDQIELEELRAARDESFLPSQELLEQIRGLELSMEEKNSFSTRIKDFLFKSPEYRTFLNSEIEALKVKAKKQSKASKAK